MSRIFFVGVFAAVFFCAFAGAGEVPLNGKVAKVTVYTSGIARVSRLAGVELPVGLSVIRSAPLPVRADISSVQVSFPGAEGVSIESVETRRILMDESKLEGARAEYLKKIEAQEDKLFEVRQKLRAVDEDMASLHETLAFIASVRTQSAQAASREMSVQQLNVDSWDKALSMTEARSIEARKKIRELTAKRRGILKLVGNEEVVLNDIRRNYPNNKYENFVYIKVLAKKAGKVQADLTYNVNGAEWEPSYRARADLEGKTLSLDIFGTVKQDSGEDWKDVVLSLSTARPDIGTDIPTLSPWYLKATGRGKVIFDGEDKPACKLIIGAGVSSEESFIGSPATVRKPVKPQPTKAVTSGAVTVFTANAKAVIPADNYRHRIPVKTIDTPIEIEHVAIPKVMPYAFIRASATNKSEVPLLPGVVDVVVGESYCGRGTIDMTSPGEVLRIGLGIDENIKVEMKILDDKVERRRRGD
ncbi:MAG: mucoidy inhibitor MuiA family protein, partial [Planctomycetes bacterium]|nr:mucoidy inhibitor MuiA family protein [Planctomycetota bacterium]